MTSPSEQFKKAFLRIENKVKKGALEGLSEAINLYKNEVISGIQSSGSQGRTYGNHTASKEGKYPNTDTGRLVGSIYAKVNHSVPEAECGSKLDYAKYLQYGTRKMGKRPFLTLAYDKTKNEIKSIINKSITQ